MRWGYRLRLYVLPAGFFCVSFGYDIMLYSMSYFPPNPVLDESLESL